MKIIPTSQIKELDAYTIEHEPIDSVDLMERAAGALTLAIVSRFPNRATPVTVFCGPGNNGGDGLALARMMASEGYVVQVYLFNPKNELSPDCEVNKERLMGLENVEFTEVSAQFVPPALTEKQVVIDALFGSGLNRGLTGGFAAVVRYINASKATVIAVDVPSGLMGEDNLCMDASTIIHASITYSLQLPKLSFLFAENEDFVGEWHLLDICLSEEGIEKIQTPYYLSEASELCAFYQSRSRFAHKGTFGRALLIAGSEGMAGASVLASRACLRSGVGLLKVHVPFANNVILQTAVPEAMTEIDFHNTHFSETADTDGFQAVGIGPGLGQAKDTEVAFLGQLENTVVSMVIDADAINLLSKNRKYLKTLPKGSILTPHPKELERLVGSCSNSYERLTKAMDLSEQIHCVIVLKGAFTAVIAPDRKVYFNPTGNPGMATGGSGDVLTGILLALLAQGYDSLSAARLGVYVHGLAGDIAVERGSEMGLTAGDIAETLPLAWKKVAGRS